MSFPAHVLQLAVAASGNVSEELEIVFEEACRWNDAHASARQLMLHPVYSLSQPPSVAAQVSSHRQSQDEADVLIGIFGAGAGMLPEDSGAVEAVKRQVCTGKTALVFFFEPPGGGDHRKSPVLQLFRDECGASGIASGYPGIDAFRVAFRRQLARELDHLRYAWLPEPVPAPQKTESPFSAEAEQMLAAAAMAQGTINTSITLGREVIQAGRETLSDGTPRKTALLKEAMRELANLGLVEPEGTKSGCYRLTGSGYRAADSLIEEHPLRGEPEARPGPTPRVQPMGHAPAYRPARH